MNVPWSVVRNGLLAPIIWHSICGSINEVNNKQLIIVITCMIYYVVMVSRIYFRVVKPAGFFLLYLLSMFIGWVRYWEPEYCIRISRTTNGHRIEARE